MPNIPLMVSEVTIVEDPVQSSSEGVLFESVITFSKIGKLNNASSGMGKYHFFLFYMCVCKLPSSTILHVNNRST